MTGPSRSTLNEVIPKYIVNVRSAKKANFDGLEHSMLLKIVSSVS